ncbi:Eisosome component PIL1-domain-containing protein [Russula compacta]|nr:Eisosome component PIL1-domain-containing protein [Russula compacta]
MPVPGFLSSIADKAQTALNNTPISQHIPSLTGASSTPTDGGSAHKNYTLEQIQHQFRQLQQNYSPTSPVQKIITAGKGVALDFDGLSRDARAQSKELYLWGQKEHSDVKDASDRLAFLNYTSGSLASTLSVKLNTARTPLKELRDSEVTLVQRRNVRNGLEYQISRVENGQERGYEKRVAELKEQLAKAESDDEPIEKQHEILLRKALKESELQKFQALREYGEKLALLAQAAESVLAILPSIPPSSNQPYTGVEETGSIRASLQYALDHWKPGQVSLSAPAEAILDRSNTGSFGVTHAEELKRIETVESQNNQQRGTAESPVHDSSPASKPDTSSAPVQAPVPVPLQGSHSASSPPSSLQTQHGSFNSPLAAASTSPSINPAALNNEPAPIPLGSPPVAVTLPGSADTEAKVPTVTPTVAETGIPVSGGAGGPGPSSGSLGDIRSPTSGSSQGAPSIADTPVPKEGSSDNPPRRYESAEEEKRRLEREARERLLQGDAAAPSAVSSVPAYGSASGEKDEPNVEGGEDTPPPYQDI